MDNWRRIYNAREAARLAREIGLPEAAERYEAHARLLEEADRRAAEMRQARLAVIGCWPH